MTEEQRHREQEGRLLQLLAQPHEHLYLTSADFNSGIRLLCRVLPKFVDLMAEDAKRQEIVQAQMAADMERDVRPIFVRKNQISDRWEPR